MRFPILISYAYAIKDPDSFKMFLDCPYIEILLDSGAFTAKTLGLEIKLSDYCTFLDEYGSRLFRYLALDVVGDPAATDVNLKEMIRAGYKPVPVHVLGDDQKRMDELFELSDYVALAGLLRPGRGHSHVSYVNQKMLWAAGRPVHWLGFVREELFGSLMPASCDSSSWMSALRYGNLAYYCGRGSWARTGSDGFNHRSILRNANGLTTSYILKKANRLLFSQTGWRKSIDCMN